MHYHRADGVRGAGGQFERDHRPEAGAEDGDRPAQGGDQVPGVGGVLGDGGVYSSIDDLARWDAALYDERLLSARSLQLAFTPATATDDPAVRYGFGWRISGETLWHSGETVGFRNVIVRYPRRHFTVILLTNRDAP